MAFVNIVQPEERYAALMKQYEPAMANAINQSNAAYKNQADTISQIYQQQIDETSRGYDDLEKRNNVQKYINERVVSENMANSGLTDSGLNRTQQTAVQLSYANNQNNIALQRQIASDAITKAMTAKLADNESARASAEMGIRQNYENMATTAANNAYKADVDALKEQAKWEAENALALQKAQISANAKVASAAASSAAKSAAKAEKALDKYILQGAKSEGIETGKLTYKNSAGKKMEVEIGKNPYTGTYNKDVFTNGKYDPSRTFSNGYQPKYIGQDKLTATNKTAIINGNEVTVWKTSDNSEWIWDGKNNRYRLYDSRTDTYE